MSAMTDMRARHAVAGRTAGFRHLLTCVLARLVNAPLRNPILAAGRPSARDRHLHTCCRPRR